MNITKKNWNKNIDYATGYKFNKTECLTSQEKGVVDGWRSINSFDLKECEQDLRNQINKILEKIK